MSFLNELEKQVNYTTTENGAVALSSTTNSLLDAFGSLGAMRESNEQTIIDTFSKAYRENRELALRLLFYIRDIRGGQGERKVFQTILRWLVSQGAVEQADVTLNLSNILYYGCGKDLLCLLDTNVKSIVMDFMRDQLALDYASYKADKPCSLLAKWMPSENASSAKTKCLAKQIRKHFQWTSKEYRTLLSTLREYIGVVERKMSSGDWANIDYATVPAKAALNYADAFFRHNEDGYINYLTNLTNGDTKINAASLFPVNIVEKISKLFGFGYHHFNRGTDKDRKLLDAMWKALPNYFERENESAICVVDTSGSMTGTPMNVAISLGMYCADKCSGPFKDHFITFSEYPQLHKLSGRDIVEKYQGIHETIASTNIEAVFNLILNTALNSGCSQEELPSKIYIISDMQFDTAIDYHEGDFRKSTLMTTIKEKFERNGYKMPSLIYWNVRASKCGMFQETVGGENCAMVSGYSPSLFKSVIEGTIKEETTNEKGEKVVREKIDPMTVMIKTLMNERYDKVVY